MTLDAASVSAISQALSLSMGLRFDSMRTDLNHKLSKQSLDLEASLKIGIKETLAPIVSRQDDLEAESETRFKVLEDQITHLHQILKNSTLSQFPALPTTAQFEDRPSTLPPASTTSTTMPAAPSSSMENPEPESLEVRKIIFHARSIIGIGPVTPEHVSRMTGSTREECLRLAAIEFLREELDAKEYEIPDVDVVRAFTAHNVTSYSHIYVQFSIKTHAEFCLFLARTVLKNKNCKVFLYIPKQLYSRFKALDNEAYKMRRQGYKTMFNFTEVDINLLTSPRGHYNFTPCQVPNLPPIFLTPVRSPPRGRNVAERPRSCNTSPDNPNPKEDRNIPNTESGDEADATKLQDISANKESLNLNL